MAAHEKFNLESLAGARAKAEALGVGGRLRFSEDVGVLGRPWAFGDCSGVASGDGGGGDCGGDGGGGDCGGDGGGDGGGAGSRSDGGAGSGSSGGEKGGARLVAPNRIAILPMEGCDCEPDGSPSELARRRYLRFYGGGAGLVWWEACAVAEEGRANPLQMMLTEGNVAAFADLLARCKTAAMEGQAGAQADGRQIDASANGRQTSAGTDRWTDQRTEGCAPVAVLQLTHSGRYSHPRGGKPAPVFPQHDPILDPISGVAAGDAPVSDEYLAALPQKYARAAELARAAGFDGVDIKCCHRYLLSELLAAHTRPGPYGGSFENRTRLLREIVQAVRTAAGADFLLASRFNVFDYHPYPYGFGVDKSDFRKFDPEEPRRLVQLLLELGCGLLSNSAGNPYYIYPQVTRPFDTSSTGVPVPDEHPMESVARLFELSAWVQGEAGDVPVVGNGYSWLRQFAPYAGAANVAAGDCAFMGFGRMAIAYPDAPNDILRGSGLDPAKCCVACSRCTQIMRDHGKTGCAIRDAAVYAPLYRQYRAAAEAGRTGTVRGNA